MQTIRYGLVGTGMMGVEHLHNLAITPGAVVTAIADPVPESLARARGALGDRAHDVAAFDTAAALAASGLVDAVVVASPNHTHRDVLPPLFDAGLHILCEKPVATTIDDARWIVARAAAARGVFWTAMEYRYMPPAAAFIADIHAGRVGRSACARSTAPMAGMCGAGELRAMRSLMPRALSPDIGYRSHRSNNE